MPAKKKHTKKKTGATRNAAKSTSKLSWIISGVLLCSFIAFLLYLDKIPTDNKKSSVVNEPQASQQGKTQKIKPVKHQFDFYTVLPDREIEIIEVEDNRLGRVAAAKTARQKTIEKKPVTKTPVTKNKLPLTPGSISLYQLQVGAFKELSKADAMKARLAFLGVESNIQFIQINGQKLYRVRVGPSTDSNKINRIKNQLKAQNINTFIQKLSG